MKLKSHLKITLYTLVLLTLFQCNKQEDIDAGFVQEEVALQFGVPSITAVQSQFESVNQSSQYLSGSVGTSARTTEDFDYTIHWEASSVKSFHEDIDILYTPIHISTVSRMKSLLASVDNNGYIESYNLTLVYDGNASAQKFSGYIFKHDMAGNFLAAYRYSNGTKTETYSFDGETSGSATSRTGGCNCHLTVADIVAMSEFCGDCVGNMLDCACVSGGGGSSGNTGNEDGTGDWSDPNGNLFGNGDDDSTGNSGGGGSTGNPTPNNDGNGNNDDQGDKLWWLENNCLNGLQMDANGICVYNQEIAINETYFSKNTDDSKSKVFFNTILPCFDIQNNQNAYHDVTIYVKQPVANSDEINVGANAGHTFIQITQGANGNTVTQVVGFYPDEDDVSPNNPEVFGTFIDDSNEEYDVSLQVELTSNQFNSIIEYLSTFNTTTNNDAVYDLNDFNCSDFGLKIFNLSGITLPDTQGVWGGDYGYDFGQGTCPALLGQDIRNTDFGPNVIKDTNGGNAYSSSDNDCQ